VIGSSSLHDDVMLAICIQRNANGAMAKIIV